MKKSINIVIIILFIISFAMWIKSLSEGDVVSIRIFNLYLLVFGIIYYLRNERP